MAGVCMFILFVDVSSNIVNNKITLELPYNFQLLILTT